MFAATSYIFHLCWIFTTIWSLTIKHRKIRAYRGSVKCPKSIEKTWKGRSDIPSFRSDSHVSASTYGSRFNAEPEPKGKLPDNAAMESFFSTIKSEYFYLNKFEKVNELEMGLKVYIH